MRAGGGGGGGGGGEAVGARDAFMIAIMPNTISREILSADRSDAARVGSCAKNNNEMSTENERGLARGVEGGESGRPRKVTGNGGGNKATSNGDRKCHSGQKWRISGEERGIEVRVEMSYEGRINAADKEDEARIRKNEETEVKDEEE